jgi:hypothetical protein
LRWRQDVQARKVVTRRLIDSRLSLVDRLRAGVGGIRSRTSVTIQTRGPRGGESLAHVPPIPNYLTRRLIDSRLSLVDRLRAGVAAVGFSNPSKVWNILDVGGIRSRTSVTIQTRGPRGGESLAHVPPIPNYLVTRRLIDSRLSLVDRLRAGVAAVGFSNPSKVWNWREAM